MEKKLITRKELYELLCAMPLTMLAAEHSVSVNGLRKICREKKIPLPPNGHWSRLKFGKPSKLLELPEEFTDSTEINLDEIKLVKNPDSQHEVLRQSAKDTEEQNGIALKVPKKLVNPDSLITYTKNYYDAVKQHDFSSGLAYPFHTDALNINVSEKSTSRALLIMDTIIKILRARRYDIVCSHYKTYVVVDGGEIEIKLRERDRVSKAKKQLSNWQLESTKKMVFIIGNYRSKEIGDGKEPLEAKLATIIAIIDSEAETLKQQRIASEQWRRLQDEKQRIEDEIREQKAKESRKFKDLFLEATRLHQANIIRTYIQALETDAIKNGSLTSELKDWINWAKKKADWYDPLINEEDPILDNSNKATIFKEFLKEWQ
jgi:hypothetical protein